MNSRITWPLFSRQTSFNSRITWPLIKIFILLRTRALLGHFTLSQSPEISRISWPLYNNSYTPLNSRITRSTYLRSESGNLAYYLATLEKFLYSYEFAYYLDTLFKTDFVYLAYYLATLLIVRVRKSRVLVGHFITILILLRIRALLGHSFQDRLRLTRVLRDHLCIYISPVAH